MKNKLKIIIYLFLLLLGLGSLISSIIIEFKFLDSNVIWQCLLGAGWTMASLFILAFGLIGCYNTMIEKESPQKKKIYFNIDGKQKVFKNKEKFIKLEDIKQFLLTSNFPEKIYILSENNVYCALEVYMESKNSNLYTCIYDLATRQFFIDETSYKDIDDAIEYLKKNQFVLKDENVCVIGYEDSTPYYLQKRIEDKH